MIGAVAYLDNMHVFRIVYPVEGDPPNVLDDPKWWDPDHCTDLLNLSIPDLIHRFRLVWPHIEPTKPGWHMHRDLKHHIPSDTMTQWEMIVHLVRHSCPCYGLEKRPAKLFKGDIDDRVFWSQFFSVASSVDPRCL